MKVAWDYHLRLQDYGPENEFDDKLWEWISILRSCNPKLVVAYGQEPNQTAVVSKADLQAARVWLADYRQRTCARVFLTQDIVLTVGLRARGNTGALGMNLMDWAAVLAGDPGGYGWNLYLERDDLLGLFNAPPVRAAEVFRRLIEVTRPYQADWNEFRNGLLLQSTCYSESGRTIPESLPAVYPSEAVAPGWLLFYGIPNRYPDGIWWFNYWGPQIVAEFGRELMQGLPVPHVEETADGGFIFWLCDDLFTIDRPEHLRIQRQALEYLDFREHQLGWVEPKRRAEPIDWGPLSVDE